MNRSGSANTLRASGFGQENILLEQSMSSAFMSNTILRDKSPNRSKIAQLAERLTETHLSAKDQKLAMKKETHAKLQEIEEDIEHLQKTTEAEISNIREETRRVEEVLELERKEKEISMIQGDKRMQIVQNAMEIELSSERYQLSPIDSIMNPSSFGEKFYSLKLDLAKEKKLREEISKEFFEDVEDRLNELRGEIGHLNKTRAEANDKLVKRLSQEINNFHQLLAEERKKRKQTHERMVNTVKEIQKKIMQDLNDERNEREDAQDALIKLLEDT